MVVADARRALLRRAVEVRADALVYGRLARQRRVLQVGHGALVPRGRVAAATASGQTGGRTQHRQTEVAH